jgi:hypothetical protein
MDRTTPTRKTTQNTPTLNFPKTVIKSIAKISTSTEPDAKNTVPFRPDHRALESRPCKPRIGSLLKLTLQIGAEANMQCSIYAGLTVQPYRTARMADFGDCVSQFVYSFIDHES